LTFGNDTRSGSDIKLASARMYSFIAIISRRIAAWMALFETSAEDFEADQDYFAGMISWKPGKESSQVSINQGVIFYRR